MDRIQWKSAHDSQRLDRQRAVWALAGALMVVAVFAFSRVQQGDQRGETLAVSVPAASSPAADVAGNAVQS